MKKPDNYVSDAHVSNALACQMDGWGGVGLSAKGTRNKVKGPEGSPTENVSPEGPQIFNLFLCILHLCYELIEKAVCPYILIIILSKTRTWDKIP